jgi:hypothetical protein
MPLSRDNEELTLILEVGFLCVSINTTIYWGFLDKLHGYMFRPVGGHLQTIKICKDKIKIAKCILVW